MNRIPEIFDHPTVDLERIESISRIPEPRSRYIIAITPRSGSSYLCDAMTRTRRFGNPSEVLNQQFIEEIMKKVPGRNADEYLRNLMRARKSANGVAGLKASWFQFRNFHQALDDDGYLFDFRYIYLTRRDLAAQAVSLYKATETDIFHTNVKPSESAMERLQALEYDYEKIEEWYEHILRQERGWWYFFYRNRIVPLHITYEEIDEDLMAVLRRIATFVDVDPGNVVLPEGPSAFQKVRDYRNIEWAFRFSMERAGRREGFRSEDTLSPHLSPTQ